MKWIFILLLMSGCKSYYEDYKYNVAHLLQIDPQKAKYIIRDSLKAYPKSQYWNEKFKEINL